MTGLLQAVHWGKAGPVGRNWVNPNMEPLVIKAFFLESAKLLF
jgi:hypothetical protein